MLIFAVASVAGNPNLFKGSDGKNYAKFFLINDQLNLRNWQVTEASIPQYIETFKDMPYVVEPELAHFGADLPEHDLAWMMIEQEKHRKGNIIEVAYDAKLKEAYAMVEITDDAEWAELTKMTTAIYVSPAIAGYAIDQPDGSLLYHEWYGAHLARVAGPAYGVMHASLKKTCQGAERDCMEQLIAAASTKISSNDKQTCSCKQKNIMVAAAATAEQELEQLKKANAELEEKLKTALQTAKEHKDLSERFAALENKQKEKIAVEIADLKVDAELIQKDKHKEAVTSLMKFDAPTLESLLLDQRVASEKIKELQKNAGGTKSNDRVISTIRTASADDNGISKPVKTLADMEGWM